MNIYLKFLYILIFFHEGSNIIVCLDSSTKTGIELKIDGNSSTNDYDYCENKTKRIRTYTSKGSKAFNSIKVGGTEIWKTDKPDEYASIVEVTDYHFDNMADITFTLDNKARKKFIKVASQSSGSDCSFSWSCFFTLGSSNFCKSSSFKWEEIDLTKKRPVLIDVYSEHESCFYFNSLEGGVKTFTPKDGFTFNHVRTGFYTVWNADTSSNYSNKVTYEANLFVTIHLGDGSIKKFKYQRSKQSGFCDSGCNCSCSWDSFLKCLFCGLSICCNKSNDNWIEVDQNVTRDSLNMIPATVTTHS